MVGIGCGIYLCLTSLVVVVVVVVVGKESQPHSSALCGGRNAAINLLIVLHQLQNQFLRHPNSACALGSSSIPGVAAPRMNHFREG